MMKKRVLGLLLSLSLIVTLLPTFAGAVSVRSFTDVKQSDWFYEDVDYVTSRNYFIGTTNTTFSPQRTMTRAMFVVVLARMEKVTVDNTKTSFSDVPAGSWCSGAVDWAARNGIVTGYGDGTFNPNGEITRQQMCAIMARYIDYCSKHGKNFRKKAVVSGFGDESDIAATFKSAVQTCISYGIIYGYKDGNFYPTWTATRAHVAAVIHRLALLVQAASGGGSGGGGGGGGGGTTPVTNTTTTTTSTTDSTNLLWTNGVTPAAEAARTDIEAVKAAAEKAIDASHAKAELDDFADYTLNYSEENGEIILEANGKLNGAVIKQVAEQAIDYAINLVGEKGLSAADDVYDKTADIVHDVLDSLNVDHSQETVRQVAQEVYDKIQDKSKEYCNDIWDALVGAKFEKVELQQDGKTLVGFNYDGTTLDGSSRHDAVKKVAKAVAKCMIEDLHTVTSESTVLNLSTEDHFKAVFTGAETQTVETVTTTTTVTTTKGNEVISEESSVDVVEKDPVVTYDAAASNTYTLTLNVNLDGEGILSYFYDGEDNLVVTVTDGMKDAYNSTMERVVVMGAKAVAGVKSSGSADSMRATLSDGEIDYAKAEKLIPGITKMADRIKAGSITSNELGITFTYHVDDVDAKIAQIVATLIEENGPYLCGTSDTVVTADTAEFVLDLLTEVIDSMIADLDKRDVSTTANALMGTSAMYQSARDEVREKIGDLIDALDSDGTLSDALYDYVAYSFDAADGNEESQAALPGVTAALEAATESTLSDTVSDKLENLGSDRTADIIKKTRIFGNYDGVINYAEGKEASYLVAKVVNFVNNHKSAIDSQKDLTDYIAKIVKKIPSSNPSLTIGGVKLSGSDFKALKNAASNSDAIIALFNVIDQFGTMKIDDFQNGVKVVAKGSVRGYTASVTFNLYVRY